MRLASIVIAAASLAAGQAIAQPLPAGWYYQQQGTTVLPGQRYALSVNCPAGAEIISGGYHVSGAVGAVYIETNSPVFGNPNGWRVNVVNVDNVGRAIVLEVTAHCTA